MFLPTRHNRRNRSADITLMNLRFERVKRALEEIVSIDHVNASSNIRSILIKSWGRYKVIFHKYARFEPFLICFQ